MLSKNTLLKLKILGLKCTCFGTSRAVRISPKDFIFPHTCTMGVFFYPHFFKLRNFQRSTKTLSVQKHHLRVNSFVVDTLKLIAPLSSGCELASSASVQKTMRSHAGKDRKLIPFFLLVSLLSNLKPSHLCQKG